MQDTSSGTPLPRESLSRDEAVRMALRSQGLLGATDRRAGVEGVLRRLGAVQLDTISVLARSHELVPYSRLGPVGRTTVERAFWGHRPARTFEYWSHAASVLPVEEWPWFAFRRRDFRRRGRRWHDVPEGTAALVMERLRAEGPLTATELGGAKNGGPWWDWSHTKIAVEYLLDVGDVVVTERRGWRRVYDLPERALPTSVLGNVPSDDECHRRLVGLAGLALGVADIGDLADYHRLSRDAVTRALPDSGLVPVTVEGWREPAWAHPEAVAGLGARGRHRTTLLSPFDSLVWDRRRTRRLFGFTHALEAYKPRAQRRHGYFAMPVLAGGRLVARVDPARERGVLVARQVTLEKPSAVVPVAAALHEAARWVGAEEVRVDCVEPLHLEAALGKAVAADVA